MMRAHLVDNLLGLLLLLREHICPDVQHELQLSTRQVRIQFLPVMMITLLTRYKLCPPVTVIYCKLPLALTTEIVALKALLGRRAVELSSCLVMGLLRLQDSHLSIASRSYVYPSSNMTGSSMI